MKFMGNFFSFTFLCENIIRVVRIVVILVIREIVVVIVIVVVVEVFVTVVIIVVVINQRKGIRSEHVLVYTY